MNTDKPDAELLPCPFCGQRPIIESVIFGEPQYGCGDLMCAGYSIDADKERWNTRNTADKDRQIAVLENRTACLTGEVTALRKTLKECRIKWDTADNGMCAVCRTGFRLFDLKGNVQKCENTECLSHRIDEALSYGDSCDICGKEMKSKGQEERIKNAIFGAHSNCLDIESQRIQEGENA